MVVSTVDVLEANRLLLGRGLATSSSSLGGTVVGATSVASGTVFEASESVSELLVVNRRLVVVVSTVDVLEASRLLLGRELTTSSSSLGTTVAGAASVDSAVVFEASESTSEVLEVNLRLTELLKRDAFAVSDDVLGSSVGFLEVNLLKREVTVDGVLSVRELKRLVYRDVTGASSSFLVTPSVVRELISRLLTRHDSGSSDVDDDDVLDVVTRELKRELVRVGSASGIACDSSTTALDQVEVDLRIGSISIDVFRVGTGVGSSFNKKNNFFQMNKTSSWDSNDKVEILIYKKSSGLNYTNLTSSIKCFRHSKIDQKMWVVPKIHLLNNHIFQRLINWGNSKSEVINKKKWLGKLRMF